MHLIHSQESLRMLCSPFAKTEDWRRDYMTLQQEYQERFQEGKIEGKIELLAHDFHLTVPEIAEKLLLSEDEVQRILDHLQ